MTNRKLSTRSWVENLCEHLELMRENALSNSLSEVMKRKRGYDKNSVKRSFEEGSKVLCHIPGMIPKLQDAWEGPFVVKHKLSAVNYRIAEEDGKKRTKVVHINNMKGFKEKEQEIFALTVIMEEDECEWECVEECEG